jgi:hypothetical protein
MDLLATYFVGGASNAALFDAAVRAMEAGVDTPALRMLAGLSGAADAWELENLIGRTARENPAFRRGTYVVTQRARVPRGFSS